MQFMLNGSVEHIHTALGGWGGGRKDGYGQPQRHIARISLVKKGKNNTASEHASVNFLHAVLHKKTTRNHQVSGFNNNVSRDNRKSFTFYLHIKTVPINPVM